MSAVERADVCELPVYILTCLPRSFRYLPLSLSHVCCIEGRCLRIACVRPQLSSPPIRSPAYPRHTTWLLINMHIAYAANLKVSQINKGFYSTSYQCCGSGSQRANMAQKYCRKQLINFIFCFAGWSLLRTEGFSCSLGDL